MKKRLVMFAILTLVLAQCAVALADNQTWFDRKYDFSAVKAIYLQEPVFAQNVEKPEQITQLQMRDEFFDRLNKFSNLQALDDSGIKDMLLRYMLIDYDELLAKDSDEAGDAFNRGIANFSQLRIQPVVQRYDTTREWKEPYTYTTTKYENIKIKKEDGKETTITVPRTEEHYVEGHYEYTQNIKVYFNIYSTKDDKMVFSYVDDRSADKEGIDMYKRMVDSFCGKLKKIL